MTRRPHALLLAVLLGLIVAAPAREASASGILVARFGAEHGHPTTPDVTAIYYNPAGLALRGGTRLYVDGAFAYRTVTYIRPVGAIDHPNTTTPADGVAANSGQADLTNYLASPFIGVASDLGVPNLSVGAAFYTPFGGVADWKKRDQPGPYPGAVDGPARWSSIEGTIRSSYVSGAVAYRIPSLRLSLGLSGNAVMSTIDTVRARNVNGTDDLVSSTGAPLEGRSIIDVKGTHASIGVGVVVEPTDAVWIGASYQSQPNFGEMTLGGKLRQKLGGAAEATDEVEVIQALPDVIRAGVRVRPTKESEVRLFGDFARWSVLENQCLLGKNVPDRKCAFNADGSLAADGSGVLLNLPRNWKNAFGVRAGGSIWVKPELEVFFGAGYDGNAVPDETIDPSLFDMDKVSASFGARVELLDKKLLVDASWNQVVYFERKVSPRTRDAMGEPAALRSPSRNPDMAGTYRQSVGVLVLGVGYAF